MMAEREILVELAKLWPLALRLVGGDEDLASVALHGSGADAEQHASPVLDRSRRPHHVRGALQRFEDAATAGSFTHRDQPGLQAYLKQALKYAVLDIFRAQNASAGITVVSLTHIWRDEEGEVPVPDPAPSPLEEICRQESQAELHEVVSRARDNLSPALRETLDVLMGVLSEEDAPGKQAWAEVGRRLNLAPNTVYQRKFQLRNSLSEALSGARQP
jgi:hypothetical protein